MSQVIGNPIHLVQRIRDGWSAAQCVEAMRCLDHDALERWGHFLDGAETAFRCMGEYQRASETERVGFWIDQQLCFEVIES